MSDRIKETPALAKKKDDTMNDQNKTAASKTTKTSSKPQTSKSATAKAAKPAAAAKTETPAAKPEPAPATPAPKPTEQEGTHRLRVGDVFKGENGVEHVVWFLNESRACVAPLDSEIKHRTDDSGVIRFIAGKNSQNISPESLVEITQQLGRKGLAEYIDNKEKQKAEESMKTKTAAKAAKSAAKKTGASTPGIRAGSLGTYEGFSVASVVRRLAHEGWNAKEIRAFLDKEKIESSDQTIKINIYRGVRKEHHAAFQLAPLQKLPAKPVIKEDPKPAAKSAKPAAPAKAEKTEPKKATPAAKPAKVADQGTTKSPAKASTPAAPAKKSPAEKIAELKAAKAKKTAAAKAAA